MRALAVVVVLSAWLCRLHAHEYFPAFVSVYRALLPAIGTTNTTFDRLLTCGETIGPVKCIQALSVWRARNALDTFANDGNARFNLSRDLEQFPWERYRNSSDELLYSQLCDETEKLLQHRSLTLVSIPSYKVELESKGHGKLNFDVYKTNDKDSARGKNSMKKLKQKFYNIVPYLLLPGLIMSAILPFLLPALKLMTVGVGILNNMAFTGAIFTLLRNNAFNDRYENKVVYVNAGYKNEKHAKEYADQHNIRDTDFVDDNFGYNHDQKVSSDYIVIDETPSNSVWIDRYGEKTEYNIQDNRRKSNKTPNYRRNAPSL